MKTVTGKLVSTKPISLSNAAKYISRFTSSDNGASNSIGIYLQRATDSFDGLVAFHKKLKGEKAHSRRQAQITDADTGAVGASGENLEGERVKKRKRKGEVNKSEDLAEKNDDLEVRNGDILKNEPTPDGVVEKKRRRKKVVDGVGDEGDLGMKEDKEEEGKKGGVEGVERRKKKKVVDGVGNEGHLGMKDDKEEEEKKGGVEGTESKKRKHREVVDGEDSKNLNLADDQSGKRKKKKRKIEGEGK